MAGVEMPIMKNVVEAETGATADPLAAALPVVVLPVALPVAQPVVQTVVFAANLTVALAATQTVVLNVVAHLVTVTLTIALTVALHVATIAVTLGATLTIGLPVKTTADAHPKIVIVNWAVQWERPLGGMTRDHHDSHPANEMMIVISEVVAAKEVKAVNDRIDEHDRPSGRSRKQRPMTQSIHTEASRLGRAHVE